MNDAEQSRPIKIFKSEIIPIRELLDMQKLQQQIDRPVLFEITKAEFDALMKETVE